MPDSEKRTRRYYTPGPPRQQSGSPPQNMFQLWADSPSIFIEQHEHEKWESRGIPSPYKDPVGYHKATGSGLGAWSGLTPEEAKESNKRHLRYLWQREIDEAIARAGPPGWIGRNSGWLSLLVFTTWIGVMLWIILIT